MTFLVGSASYVNATMGDVNVFAGYRHDSIEHKDHVPSHDPVFKQSTKFKDIDIFQIGVNVRSTIGCNFYARAEATWGWVLDGEVKRKASYENHFSNYSYGSGSYEPGTGFNTLDELEFRNAIDDKYVYDVNVAIGYPFYFCDCSAIVAPVIGYSVNSQNLSTYDNDFILGSDYCGHYLTAGSNCCKHTFMHRWYGPFVGVDFNYRPYHDCWNLYAAVEYHWGRCKVKTSDFSDNGRFSNHADMDGWVVDLGADYQMSECWTVGLYLKFTEFCASKHHKSWDSEYSESGPRGKRHTDWNSYAVNLEFGRAF